MIAKVLRPNENMWQCTTKNKVHSKLYCAAPSAAPQRQSCLYIDFKCRRKHVSRAVHVNLQDELVRRETVL